MVPTSEVTNEDRAAWAATAIGAFTAACHMQGEDSQTKATDLAGDLVHYLRIYRRMSFKDAASAIKNAIDMAEEETSEDPDFVDDLPPPPRIYGIRMWATFRAVAETNVAAISLEDAVEKAKAIDMSGPGDFSWNIADGNSPEGDETVHVYGPENVEGEEDEWGGEAVEVDRRADSEPFSWDACQLVKDLAELNPVAELLPADDPILNLINRAKALCKKD